MLKRNSQLKTTTPLRAKTNLQAKTTVKKRKSKRRDVKAANLARYIWRQIGYCEYCLKRWDEVQLQGAHIIGTGASPRLCSDLRNGISLCSYDHRRFTSDPLAFYEWLLDYLPDGRLALLRQLQKSEERIDWDARLEFLNDIKKALDAKEITLEEAIGYEGS